MSTLKSGEKVPASGIYQAIHSMPHIKEQREMYFEGSCFPPCPVCPQGVLYRLESPWVSVGMRSLTELASAVC